MLGDRFTSSPIGVDFRLLFKSGHSAAFDHPDFPPGCLSFRFSCRASSLSTTLLAESLCPEWVQQQLVQAAPTQWTLSSDEWDTMFGPDNIRDIRTKLDVSKATGIDGVGPMLLKYLPDDFDVLLSYWFHALVGGFPAEWTMSLWTLLHKGGFG